jgi:hypothetical protein
MATTGRSRLAPTIYRFQELPGWSLVVGQERSTKRNFVVTVV